MGYVARVLDTGDLSAQLFKLLGITLYPYTFGVTETTCYESTIDLTDINYMRYQYYAQHDSVTAKQFVLYFGAVKKIDQALTTATWYDGSIDCTSITGDTVIKVTLESDAGKYVKLNPLHLTNRES